MPDRTDWLMAFHTYQSQIGYGLLAAVLATLRCIHDRTPLHQWAFDAACCATLAAGADTLIDWFQLPKDGGYLTSVFIGVFGYQVVIAKIRSRLWPEN